MMQVIGDVKCYHCGHVSGQIEGTRSDRLVFHTFKPRPGYQGVMPGPGHRLRCERCGGPVYLEEVRAVLAGADPVPLPAVRPSRKRKRPASPKAA